MEISVLVSIGTLLLVAFSSLPKKLHRREVAVVWMGFVFVFVTLFGMAGPRNGDFLVMREELSTYLAIRVWEVLIIPLVLLLYLNYEQDLKRAAAKITAWLACFLALYGLELMVHALAVFQYNKWQMWWSPFVWLFFLLYAKAMQKGMRYLLRREGVLL